MRVLGRGIRSAVLASLCITAWGASAPTEVQPQPQNAVSAVLAAFDRVPIVALGGGLHGTQNVDDLAIQLVRDPRFAAKVRNVAIECGNSRYQDVLDRYVAGADVPLSQVQPAWRNTTQIFGCFDAEQRAFVDAVREVNHRQPRARRIRVLAGDPPIDWAHVSSAADVNAFLDQRDTSFTAVVEQQVLAKHENALLLIGDIHILRRPSITRKSTTTTALEGKYPHSTYVITHGDFGDRNAELEPRLANWPVPSIAEIRGTWLGSLDAFVVYNDTRIRGKIVNPFPGLQLQDLADAYLYLGPAASIRDVDATAGVDPEYARELARRRKLVMGGAPVQMNPAPSPSP